MSEASTLLEEEARLRDEAARRLERRRRKMQTSEERLSKITGQPVSASSAGTPSPDPASPMPSPNGRAPPLFDSPPNPLLPLDPVPDPPLEDLERDPFSQNRDLDGGMDANMFNNLMMGNSAGGAGVKSEVKVYTVVWVILAACTRLLLQSPYSHLVADNIVVPFLLLLTGLILTRVVDLRNLQSSSLITAALVLCGVKADRVALLTQFLHASRLLVYCFSIYLFSFIGVHLIIENYLEANNQKYFND